MKELDLEAQQVLQDIKLDAVKMELQQWVEQAEAAKNDWTLLSVDDDATDFTGGPLQAFGEAGGVKGLTDCVHSALDKGLEESSPLYSQAGHLMVEMEEIFQAMRFVLFRFVSQISYFCQLSSGVVHFICLSCRRPTYSGIGSTEV